jgi:hypothetical protein
VLTPNWRPEPSETAGPAADVPPYFGYAGVGRKNWPVSRSPRRGNE